MKFSTCSLLVGVSLLAVSIGLVQQYLSRQKLERQLVQLEKEIGYIEPSKKTVRVRQLAELHERNWVFRIQIPQSQSYVAKWTVSGNYPEGVSAPPANQLVFHGRNLLEGQFEISIRASDKFQFVNSECTMFEVSVASEGGVESMPSEVPTKFMMDTLVGTNGKLVNLAGYSDQIDTHSKVEDFAIGKPIVLLKLQPSKGRKVESGQLHLLKLELVPSSQLPPLLPGEVPPNY